jgi:hypothetical protein
MTGIVIVCNLEEDIADCGRTLRINGVISVHAAQKWIIMFIVYMISII